MGGAASQPPALTKKEEKPLPKLLLNFDVNKTIVMLDTSTGTSTSSLMNRVLAEVCWGIVGGGGTTWTLIENSEPSCSAPEGARLGDPNAQGLCDGDAVTYSDFLEFGQFRQSPDNSREETEAIKKARRSAKVRFGEPGQPGEKFTGYVRELCEKVRGSEFKPRWVGGCLDGWPDGLTV